MHKLYIDIVKGFKEIAELKNNQNAVNTANELLNKCDLTNSPDSKDAELESNLGTAKVNDFEDASFDNIRKW